MWARSLLDSNWEHWSNIIAATSISWMLNISLSVPQSPRHVQPNNHNTNKLKSDLCERVGEKLTRSWVETRSVCQNSSSVTLSSWSYCSAELNGLLSTALFLVHQEFVFDVVIRVDHLLVIDISWCLRRQWWLDIYEFLKLDCWRWLLIVVDEVKGPGKYHHLRSTVWNNFNHRHVIITLNIEQMWW